MDLKSLVPPQDPVAMVLNHPVTGLPLLDDAGQPFTLQVISSDSDEFEQMSHALADKRVAKYNASGRKPISSADTKAHQVEILVNCIKGCQNIVWDGKPLEYSRANIRMILQINWIFDQVNTFVADRSNFFADN